MTPWRLILGRLSERSISPTTRTVMRLGVSGIAMAAFGVWVAVAIGRGYQHQIRQKVFGFSGRIHILPVQMQYSYAGAPFNGRAVADSLDLPAGVHVEEYAYQPVMLHHAAATEGAVLKGVSDFARWHRQPHRTLIAYDSIPGNLPPLMLSQTLARRLNARAGDSLLVFWTDPRLRVRRFRVVGIYKAALEEIEEVFAIVPIETLRRLKRWDDSAVHGLALFPPPDVPADTLRHRLAAALPYHLEAFPTEALYPQLFDWLNLLDTNIRILLALMTVVAVVTIVVIFFVLVIERGFLIAMWKIMGAPGAFLRRVFLLLAGRILVRGLWWGSFAALLALAVQHHFRPVRLPEDIYYLPYLPVAFPWAEWLAYLGLMGGMAFVGLWLASLYFRWVSPRTVVRAEG